MSDLSPECAPKRTFADHSELWVHALALQLHFLEVSESMGNHDSKIVDAGSID